MLTKVKRPDSKEISFEYDALGRRIAKIGNKKITRYIWDGNVLLHEWSYDLALEPKIFVDDEGNVILEKESVDNVVTWVYEKDSYVPCAKIVDGQKFSIISDYLGRPFQSFDENADLVWNVEYNMYGNLKDIKGDKFFIPFRQLGQYEDEEIEGIYYNRLRYYDNESGNYISKDPIGLAGNNPTLYGYIKDANVWVDIFGLDVYDLIATSDGWYPVYEKGSLHPTSYVRLNRGDIYKIGESINPSRRYSQARLDDSIINRSKSKSVAVDPNGRVIVDANGNTISAGLQRVVDPNTIGNTKSADRLIETQKIEAYERQHNSLPPGNKTYH